MEPKQMSRDEVEPQRPAAAGWLARHRRALQALWAVLVVVSTALLADEVIEDGWSQQAVAFSLTSSRAWAYSSSLAMQDATPPANDARSSAGPH